VGKEWSLVIHREKRKEKGHQKTILNHRLPYHCVGKKEKRRAVNPRLVKGKKVSCKGPLRGVKKRDEGERKGCSSADPHSKRYKGGNTLRPDLREGKRCLREGQPLPLLPEGERGEREREVFALLREEVGEGRAPIPFLSFKKSDRGKAYILFYHSGREENVFCFLSDGRREKIGDSYSRVRGGANLGYSNLSQGRGRGRHLPPERKCGVGYKRGERAASFFGGRKG